MIKRFLGIAIEDYEKYPLYGCVSDVMLAYRVLKNVYGFNDFTTLEDEDATKNNVKNEIENSFRGLKKGDWLYIHYSGHGSYWPCNTKTATLETDLYDEVWMVYDWKKTGPLRDDDLGDLVINHDPEINVVVVSDSCFSGTMTRENPNPNIRNRFMPPPLHIILKSGDLNLDDYLAPDISKKYIDNKRLKTFLVDTEDKQNSVILISGCGEKQKSADIYIPEIKRYHGALTFNMFKTLKEHGWNMTYRNLVSEINKRLEHEEFTQTPQLECKDELFDTLFLGGIDE